MSFRVHANGSWECRGGGYFGPPFDINGPFACITAARLFTPYSDAAQDPEELDCFCPGCLEYREESRRWANDGGKV
jgi:hypothetical protein